MVTGARRGIGLAIAEALARAGAARIRLAATKNASASSEVNGRSVSAAPTAIAAEPTAHCMTRSRPLPVRALIGAAS